MTEVEYVVCPLCGFSHVWSSERRRMRREELGLPDTFWRWVDYNLLDMHFIRIRDARGKIPGPHPGRRGRGSAPGQGIVTIGGMTILEANEHPVYRRAVETMKERLLDIIRQMYQLGLLTREEILSALGIE